MGGERERELLSREGAERKGGRDSVAREESDDQ